MCYNFVMEEQASWRVKVDYGLLIWLVLALVLHYAKILPPTIDHWLLAVTAFGGTVPVIIGDIHSLWQRRFTVDLLATVALVFSLAAVEWPSAIFINLMLASARIFDYYTHERARRGIQHLLKLRPKTALVKKGGQLIVTPIEHLKPGDLVVVELGGLIPVDGRIMEGRASVNQASITGEALPVDKKVGDEVLSSTMVVAGYIVIVTERVGADTTLARMIDLIESSRRSKTAIQTLAESFTKWYIVATVIGSAILLFFFHDVKVVLSILLVVCADDIAVATPLAFEAAIGAAARHGIIVKGANYLEALHSVKTLVADKTGTLTLGQLKVEQLTLAPGFTREAVLAAAGEAFFFSAHPTALAIKNYLTVNKVLLAEPAKFREYLGEGAEAVTTAGAEVVSGRLSFIIEKRQLVAKELAQEIATAEREKGYKVVVLALDGKLAGFFTLSDQLKPAARESLAELKRLGITRTVMLTGDNEASAKRIANDLGITEYHADLLPADKIAFLKKIEHSRGKVMMLGDGVNDAAALALADMGIVMGQTGAGVSIESADIVLVKDNLARIQWLVRLSKTTMSVIHSNFIIWGAVNVIGIILVVSHVLNPTGAAAYNFITDFIPLFNSFRLWQLKIKV